MKRRFRKLKGRKKKLEGRFSKHERAFHIDFSKHYCTSVVYIAEY